MSNAGHPERRSLRAAVTAMFNRPPLDERIAARQRERGPLEPGKHFEHPPARMLFFFTIGAVVVTHIAAIVMIYFEPG